jgi:hypothetical protein
VKTLKDWQMLIGAGLRFGSWVFDVLAFWGGNVGSLTIEYEKKEKRGRRSRKMGLGSSVRRQMTVTF